jgi:hypothetical protein
VLVGIARNDGFRANLNILSYARWNQKLHSENSGRNVLYACAEGGNYPVLAEFDLCCTWKPEYGPLYWACALDLSGMVGYSGFRVQTRPD